LSASVDRQSPLPAFMQVEQDIRSNILSGRIADGARLPRETALAEKYGASRVTIRRALEELAKLDLIERVHGVGTIVKMPSPPVSCDLDVMLSFADQLAQSGYQPTVEFDRQTLVSDLPDQFQPEMRGDAEPMVLVRRIIKVDGRPLVLNSSWLPSTRFPGLEGIELAGGSLWKTLSQSFGVEPNRSRNRIGVVTASSDEARLLCCEEGTALLRLQGIVYDAQERPVEYCSALWSGNVRLNFSSHLPTGQD
jgi:DNA-binding GntR family transcriptional regulator